jgi:carboxypeptidase family protein
MPNRFLILLILTYCISAIAPSARAQSVASGTIHGTATDATNATLPGVPATLTSPALQVAQVLVVTDQEGNYRFTDPPAGTYRVTFELPGFSTLIRQGLRLTVGFVARVDVTLQVGGIEQAVTVNGQSPVVDATTTSPTA